LLLLLPPLLRTMAREFRVIDVETQIREFALAAAVVEKALDFADDALPSETAVLALSLSFSTVRDAFIDGVVGFIRDMLFRLLDQFACCFVGRCRHEEYLSDEDKDGHGEVEAEEPLDRERAVGLVV